MTEPGLGAARPSEKAGARTTTNTASDGSWVGIQADAVHISNVYVTGPDPSPDKQFEVGIRYLDNGVPGQARKLIANALARGLDSAEVRFHWVLAMLSKRSYNDLDVHERGQVQRLPEHLSGYAMDEWRFALTAVWNVLEHIGDDKHDSDVAADGVNALPPVHRDMIFRHLDLVLTGSIRDRLWARTKNAALSAQKQDDRGRRTWIYFQPDPVGPKVDVASAAAEEFARSEWVWAALCFVVFVMALGVELGLALATAPILSALALVTGVAAAGVGVPSGVEWYFRAARLADKERDHTNGPRGTRETESKFPARVDDQVQHYSVKYAPKDASLDRWLAETRGIRASLRDEIVRLYEHDGCQVATITWLIRYHVADIARRWQNGTLLHYRRRFHTPRPVKMRCYASMAVFLLCLATILLLAVSIDRALALLCMPLVGGAGWYAIEAAVGIAGRRRVITDRRRERATVLADRRDAFVRWKAKLKDRPAEHEMERWLDADKVLFIDEVMCLYRLNWREIIAYAVLQSPARSSTRARVNNGPWRYSKYELRLFLITDGGVREIDTQLDFKRVLRERQQRSTFRFEAFSSVQVREERNAAYYLDLTLMNGPTRSINVVDPQPETMERPDEISQLSLDAAGFVHALRILEGIAAEGKDWLGRDGVRFRRPRSVGEHDDD